MTLFWYLDESDLSPADVPGVEVPIVAGIESWQRVCGVTIQRTYNHGRANVIVRFVADLSADSTVPASANQALWLEGVELGLTDEPVADPPVQLSMRLNPNPSALPGGAYTDQSLQDVACHEFGHALGFDHPAAGIVSCMSADINLRVSTQTPFDVQVAQAIYGVPLSPPAAPPISASTPPADVSSPPPVPGATSMNPFLVLAETGALKLLHDELAAGAPGDIAIRSVLTAIEAQLTNPVVRAVVTDVLNAVVNAAEAAVAAA